ncbi:MAG: hypothetical protein AB3A66_24650 [Nodularia sp. CChRGM 3473]
MSQIYLDLLIIICIGLLVWGILKSERIYQFPFYMGGVFTSFILPQAVSLVFKPGLASPQAVQNVLIMSSLCAAMCWIGYSGNANLKLIKKLEFPFDEKKLLHAGILLIAFGSLCNALLFIVTPQTNSVGNWTGPSTIIYFFRQTFYIGLVILLQSVIRKPRGSKINYLLLTLSPILYTIILGGRRSPTAGLILIFALSLFFEKTILPPRLLVASVIFLGIFLIPLFGILRFGIWEKLFTGNLSVSDLMSGLDYIMQGKVLELRNAAIIMEYVKSEDEYGYGSGYWNGLVFQFVPGQILGQEFKSSLYINTGTTNLSAKLFEFTGYQIPTGSTTTGIGDSFLEFGYFGCLIFAFLAYFFKNLWISSRYYGNSFSRIIYISLIYQMHWIITHGTYLFFATNLVFNSLFLILVKMYIYDSKKTITRFTRYY